VVYLSAKETIIDGFVEMIRPIIYTYAENCLTCAYFDSLITQGQCPEITKFA